MNKKTKSFLVVVNTDLCKGCGYCEKVCAKSVYAQSSKMNSQGYEFMQAEHSENCVGCLSCVMTCPDFAITVSEQA